MNEKFGVSIKGVMYYKGKYLLRKNQRNEFELLGGKLEATDKSAEARVIQEFVEESGIKVKVVTHREPWLYEIGKKNIIIAPFICSPTEIPEKLTDEDGGELVWVPADELDLINIPYGYLDTIRNKIPRKSFSPIEGEFLKIIPNYTEWDYVIRIVVKNINGEILLEDNLPHFTAPREFVHKSVNFDFSNECLWAQPINHCNGIVYLNYIIF